MSRKQRALVQEEALRKQREVATLPRQPPRLPSHSALPQLATFGGEDARPDSIAIISNRAENVPASSAASHNFSRPSVDTYRTATQHATAGLAHVPPMPGNYMHVDPYPRAESMTHRGRYSYASSQHSAVNSPRRIRRRKDPTPFNILVIGTKGCGKSSFIDFLRTALALPARKQAHTPSPPATAVAADNSPFTSQYLETEVDGERVGVTLWDSEGLEKNIVDFQLPIITSFVESKFEDTFSEEQKVVRAPGVKDTHIHCVFLILDPTRLGQNIADARKKSNLVKAGNAVFGGLDENLDLNVLRELQGKTTVIPVISKADTVTEAHMRHLKKMVWDTLKRAKLDPLEALHLDEDEDEDPDRLDERDEEGYESHSDGDANSDVLDKVLERSSSEAARSVASSSSSKSHSPPTSPPSARKGHSRKPSAMSVSIQAETTEAPFLPLSIISPDPYEPDIVGRRFPWGFANPYDPEHCDFIKLRESVFSEWRGELREASRDQWYEGWRTNRLEKGTSRRRIATSDGPAPKQLSIPGVNGRASSAGAGDHRQHQTTNF